MNKKNYIIIDDYFENPAMNMAIDEMLFDMIKKNNTGDSNKKIGMILRFYAWKNKFCSYGYAQRIKTKPEILHKYGKNIVRRPTGGGIVFHDNDICFTLIADTNIFLELQDIEISYKLVHFLVLEGLLNFNQNLTLYEQKILVNGDYSCFQKPVNADIMLNDKKIVGSAQRRFENFLLQEGSIFFPFKECLDEETNLDFVKKIANCIKENFEQILNLNPIFEKYNYSDENINNAKLLLQNKYLQDEWNKKI